MIVELVNRSGAVLDHYQFDKQQIRVGRAYDNDLILHDEHVDGHHVVINIDSENEGFSFQDLNTVNGTKIFGHAKEVRDSEFLESGKTLCIGRTYLRVKLREHEVPPAIPISSLDNVLNKFGTLWWALLTAMILVSITTYAQYAAELRLDKLKEQALENAALLLVVCAYGGIWAFISRIQKLDGRFFVHVNICIIFFILDALYDFYSAFFDFNFNMTSQLELLQTVFGAVLCFFLIYLSMYLATRASRVKRTVISAALPLILLLMPVSKILKTPEFRSKPSYEALVVSPGWNMRGSITEEDFVSGVDKLYAESKE